MVDGEASGSLVIEVPNTGIEWVELFNLFPPDFVYKYQRDAMSATRTAPSRVA